MPGAYQAKCDRCGFCIGPEVSVITILLQENGSEVICRSPGEQSFAEQEAGRPWAELLNEGKVEFRYALICLTCGHFDYYSSASEPPGRTIQRRRWSPIWNLFKENIAASVAQFETEVRSDRQRAGIEAAREANGGKCPWGGRKAGVPNKATVEKIAVVRQLREQGRSIAEIARVVGIAGQTAYRLLAVK